MGTFMGHFLPGSFFVLFSIWWCFGIFIRYFRARNKTGPAFRNTATYPCICCCSRLKHCQIEGIIKIVCCMVGIIGEIATGLDSNGVFVHTGNAQHATMFAFFGCTGILDLLFYCGVVLPSYTDYCFAALCFAVEGILFQFHLHDRMHLDVAVHTLLIYVVVCCVGAVFAEMRWSHSVLAGLARCFCTGLQGTWFIQVGFMLYPPLNMMAPWDGHDHKNIMRATILFAWHIFIIFIFMLSVAFSVKRCIGGAAGSESEFSDELDGFAMNYRDINGAHGGMTRLLTEDEDSDEEGKNALVPAHKNSVK